MMIDFRKIRKGEMQITTTADEIERLQEVFKMQEEVIKKYAVHTPQCAIEAKGWGFERVCTCGRDAMLAKIKQMKDSGL